MTPEVQTVVVALLCVAFLSMVYVVWLIVFRLRDHLVSKSYRAILTAKILWALLCGSGIYLILWPLPQRNALVSVIWFSVMALGCISSAVGFFLYSRDVSSILTSEAFTDALPAKAKEQSTTASVVPKE